MPEEVARKYMDGGFQDDPSFQVLRQTYEADCFITYAQYRNRIFRLFDSFHDWSEELRSESEVWNR